MGAQLRAELVVAVPRTLWLGTWDLLKTLGEERFESACIWGGVRDGPRLEVRKIYPIGAAHGVVRHELSHRMTRGGASRLFEELRADGNAVVADVHTHPYDWVGLSDVDMAHPIEFRIGLVCLVLPRYASGVPSPDSIGIHVYRGDGQWSDESGGSKLVRLEVL